MVSQVVSFSAEAAGEAPVISLRLPAGKCYGDGQVNGRKKKANRSAKLKQCKLDARREQWLSQVRNKGKKDVSEPSPTTEQNITIAKYQEQPVGYENENEGLVSQDSDSELSFTISPGSSVSGNDQGGSGTNRPGTSSSSSSSSSGSCSGRLSISDDEGSCFDDWEAVADALGVEDLEKTCKGPSVTEESKGPPVVEEGNAVKSVNSTFFSNKVEVEGILRPEYKGKPSSFEKARLERATSCAWRPDDASRPRSLPNLTKHMSFPAQTDRHLSHSSIDWDKIGTLSLGQPSSCPICCEDLDLTDTSFMPCLCGFRLCLFCHNRILEADARCPGCRKPYEPVTGEATPLPPHLLLPRSCSLRMRT